MRKWLSVLLVVLISAGVLAACQNIGDSGGTQNPSVSIGDGSGTPSESEYDASNILSKFESNHYDGREFRVFCANAFNQQIFVRQVPTEDADPADRMNSALYNRDLKLNETFGIDIQYDLQPNDLNMGGELHRLVSSGDASIDMVLGSMVYSCNPLLMEGLLLDIHAISTIDLANDWWNQNMTKYFTINDKTFFATGDITTRNPTALSLFLFNTKLFQDSQMSYPYQDVYDGTWTYEKLFQLCEGKNVDLNHDGYIDLENDQVGALLDSRAGLISCGGRYTERNADGGFEMVLSTARNVDILQMLQEYYFTKDCLLDPGYEGVSAFMSDYAYFIELAGCDLSLLRDMETDYGVVPCPKYDEQQKEYYNFANIWITTCAAFPVTVKDAEFSGFVAEAMGALSKYTSSPEQYEVLMQNKELRDEESKKMLELSVKSATYDIGFIFNFGGCRDAVSGILGQEWDVSSQIAKIETAFQTDLEIFLEKFQ